MDAALSWLRTVGSKFMSIVPDLSNLFFLILLLWFAIGATCEIVTRNEDYARVVAYQKSLVSCRTPAMAGDKSCPKADNPQKPEDNEKALDFWIEIASTQVRRFNALNSLGAPDRCYIAAVFASEIGHLWEDCETVMGDDKNATLNKPQNRTLLSGILHPTSFTYSGWPLAFDERPKEPLYFLLVLASAAIGSLIAGLRKTGFTTHRDLALGIGAGFAIYLLLRSGNFVFFTGSTTADILNPFTAAIVGLLVGLYNEKAFGLLGSAIPDGVSPAAQTANKAQADAVAAATDVHSAAAAAVGTVAAGSPEQKMLQDIATAALDAKTKAETASKAQGDALKSG